MIRLNDTNVNLRDFTVIIPSIGVGNVSQLAVDLITATLQLKRLGNGYHKACMPIFGPAAYQHDINNKTTSFELYWDESLKIVVFQIRSPLVGAYLDSFHKDLVDFFLLHKIGKVVILTSSHAYEKHSPNSPVFEFLQNDQFKKIMLNLDEVKEWSKFEGNVIFGGGNAKKLYNCCTTNGLASIILFKYVSEGDNSIDASQLVGELNKIVKLFASDKTVKLLVPSSWNFLFGNNIPDLIF